MSVPVEREPVWTLWKQSADLLTQIALYYPRQYDDLNLDQAELLGRGTEAYVFLIRNVVYKFTTSREDAQVAWELTKRPQAHLVRVDDVAHLPNVGVWLIVGERLNKMDDSTRRRVDNYLEGTSSLVEPAVWDIIQDLDKLGVRDWKDDCVAIHNIMVDPETSVLKAMDFGFTKSSFLEDYPVWP